MVLVARSSIFCAALLDWSVPSVVSLDMARSKGTSGLSGAESTRAICTDCGRSLMGSRRMSAMKASQTRA